MSPRGFHRWFPYRLEQVAGKLACRWLYAGAMPFSHPFFEESSLRWLELPENSFGPPRYTHLDQLLEIADGLDTLEPTAFVFHVSRCGSTLLSQLLALDESCVMLSEVPFFDELLRARFNPLLPNQSDLAALLPAAIRLHAQIRSGHERSVIVKLDSWHTAFYPELRALFPKTPFILLYREPLAILRSHRNQPGMQAVPGLLEPALFGFDPAVPVQRAEHLQRVLGFFYERFLEIAQNDRLALLVPYAADMIPAIGSIARFLRIELTPAQLEAMRVRSLFHSKRPTEGFHEPLDCYPQLPNLQACYEALTRYQQTTLDNNDHTRAVFANSVGSATTAVVRSR